MTPNLHDLVDGRQHAAESCARTRRLIHDASLQESPGLGTGNFTSIHVSDVARLFHRYDRCVFDEHIRTALGTTPLRFRLSKRMTSSGGQTTSYGLKNRSRRRSFEISVSTTLLFQCFGGEDHRPITVAGVECTDRLEALQLITEHELVHLIEMLLWQSSSCSADRFQSIAWRFFGHRGHTHALITPRERALAKFGIKPGATVRFVANGTQHTGVVNRVTKRATVLVRDPNGVRYTDGRRYAKFYVPVELLESVTAKVAPS